MKKKLHRSAEARKVKMNARQIRRDFPTEREATIIPAGTIWELHACNGLSGMPWQVMDIFTNVSAATRDVTDAGAIDHTRFYRLVPF